MPSGANAFEISDIHKERNREPVLTSDQNIAMLYCYISINNSPSYQFAGQVPVEAKTLLGTEIEYSAEGVPLEGCRHESSSYGG